MSSSFPNCVHYDDSSNSGACGCACAEFRRKFIGLIGFGLVCCPIRDTSTQGAAQLGESKKIAPNKHRGFIYAQSIKKIRRKERAWGDVLEVYLEV